MATRRYATVEDYLEAQEPAKAQTLRTIIAVILTAFPDLEAKVSWNVPTIHRLGQYVAGLAAYKHHLTFSPWSHEIMSCFKERLADFVTFKNCFQVPVDWPVDEALVTDLVRARLAELE